MRPRTLLAPLCVALVALSASWPQPATLPAQEKPPAKGRAWTLDEALKQLQLYPRDPYLQYVALQLGRRAKRADEVSASLERLQGPGREGRAGRVDLFSLFSGALAVQESLQLDTMRGESAPRPPRRRPGDKAPGAGVDLGQ